jgi:hypothetical protein
VSPYELIGFYNRDEMCLQRGTDWGFKQSSLRFVFKGLNQLQLQNNLLKFLIVSALKLHNNDVNVIRNDFIRLVIFA